MFEITDMSGGLYLSDRTKLIELSNINKVSMGAMSQILDDKVCNFNFSTNCELTFGNSYINEGLFNKMLDVSSSKYTFTTSIPYAVQVRKHKKNRINKKWAKSYGYGLKFIDGRIKETTYNPETGEFDFSYDDETIWQLYKHAADIRTYNVLSRIGYTEWK